MAANIKTNKTRPRPANRQIIGLTIGRSVRYIIIYISRNIVCHAWLFVVFFFITRLIVTQNCDIINIHCENISSKKDTVKVFEYDIDIDIDEKMDIIIDRDGLFR